MEAGSVTQIASLPKCYPRPKRSLIACFASILNTANKDGLMSTNTTWGEELFWVFEGREKRAVDPFIKLTNMHT
jgi:hypothetical protein